MTVPPEGEYTAPDSGIPVGARAAARILLLDRRARILLLEAQEGGHRWWVAPGGGTQPGETFERAAERELYEETGVLLRLNQWVWTRRHVFEWQGRQIDQYERYFVARVDEPEIKPVSADGYVVGHRWWELREIRKSTDDFAPRRIGVLLASIIQGDYPDPPIDCGV